MQISIDSNSIIGLREVNQDSYCSFEVENYPIRGILTCDGNGGDGGKVISQIGTGIIPLVIYEHCKKIETAKEFEQVGLTALKNAAKYILNLKEDHPEWEKAGTTITLALIYPKKNLLGIFWIGDSPCYVMQDKKLTHMTFPPHTLGEMLIAQGSDRKAIEQQPRLCSILTRCAGYDEFEPSSKIIDINPPCLVLLGSDGVFGYVSEEEILRIASSTNSVKCITENLIAKALENNSDDNLTLITTLIESEQIVQDIHANKRITQIYEWRDKRWITRKNPKQKKS